MKPARMFCALIMFSFVRFVRFPRSSVGSADCDYEPFSMLGSLCSGTAPLFITRASLHPDLSINTQEQVRHLHEDLHFIHFTTRT